MYYEEDMSGILVIILAVIVAIPMMSYLVDSTEIFNELAQEIEGITSDETDVPTDVQILDELFPGINSNKHQVSIQNIKDIDRQTFEQLTDYQFVRYIESETVFEDPKYIELINDHQSTDLENLIITATHIVE